MTGSNLSDRLASGVAMTCLCWRLTRSDGLVFGLTDHDRVLTFDGTDFEPGVSLEGSVFATSMSMEPGHASARGALSSDAITKQDLVSGLWGGARIEVFRVDWQDTACRELIWAGRLSEVTRQGDAFEAQLVSLKADLERPVGRSFTRRCDAVLGDGRCGVDTQDPLLVGKTCDQRFRTCSEVFQNTENFRGFPHMPGNDYVLAGPGRNGRDGGAR